MTRTIIYTAILILLIAISCKSDTLALDCSTLTGATFNSNSGQLESIINSKCAGSACHSPGGTGANHWFITGSGSLGDHFFDEAIGTVTSGSMPPSGSPKLTSNELNLFECWSKAGYPE
ncbi:MAG: hypothetical protein IPP04_08025 [Saprospiraceae bacterium]|nr:hypothetical protein [Saprospiraceae bacterium]